MARSPSAAAFFSPLAAMPCFASPKSFVANLISSSNDCFSIPKLCVEVVSFFLASASWSLAFSRMSSSVSTMELLWLAYTVGSGAPKPSLSSSAPCALCTRALSLAAPWDPSMEDSTMRRIASVTLPAFPSCTIAAPSPAEPLRASRSRIATARSSALITSSNSFSAAAKSASSVLRIVVAALRSASLVAMLAELSSMAALCAEAWLPAWSMAASRFAISSLAVFTSYFKFFDLSSHHSLYSR
mmetsp:Transcript_117649/g.240587  ORF Transcript_117649/g.240587 Transcript_117649/m.240587 type:complete len:243 (-) Transcript_117649:237-965(-)